MRKSSEEMDTVTNLILNNEYSLHENDGKEPLEEDDKDTIDIEHYIDDNGREVTIDPRKGKHSKVKPKKKKKKKGFKHFLAVLFRTILIIAILLAIFLFLFFKTPLFEKYRDIWVETAMSTMKHQYLAKWFLSDDEINKILDKLKVKNTEDSNSNEINISDTKDDNIKVEKIRGKNYVGYVMEVPNASKVKLVDGRKNGHGTKLSQICKNNNAIAGINAGGFADANGVGNGGQLVDATILNKKLLYGNQYTKYSFIGLSSDKKLVLGNYTFGQAINRGIESAVEFGPFLIVNGKNQITNSSSGGIHPRMAIGQKKDGTFIFVVVDGRQPGYSIGTNLLELQNIFNRYGAYNAANLDGGSSATMYYNGKVVNKTSTPIGERYLPNAFIVSK